MTEGVSFQEDFARGRWDGAFFASRFLNIRLHPGQVRVFNAYLARDKSKWRPAYLTLCLSAGNRAGKTLILAILILHSTIYKMGARPPDGSEADLKRWMELSYDWYHFGIDQGTSELVFRDLVKIFAGIHQAQVGTSGCPLTTEMPGCVATDRKEQGDYGWVVLSREVLGGGQIHFRSAAENATGSLGRDMHGVSFDECAFHPKLEFIVNEVLHNRRLGTGGQLYLISTPTEGLTVFADFWEMGNPENPGRSGTRMSLRMSTRDNVGFGIDPVAFERLVADTPEELIPQNIDGYFIEGRSNYFSSESVDRAFLASLPERQEAEDRHSYAQGVDAASRQDNTWSIVLDVTSENEIVGVNVTRTRGRQNAEALIALTANSHRAYNVATKSVRTYCGTAIDATGWGGKLFREMLDDAGIDPIYNIEFGGSKQKKLKLLGDLKTLLDQGKLKFPRSGQWLGLRRQLLGYKLADRAIEQDAVMALACAVAVIRRIPAADDGNLSFNMYTQSPFAQRWAGRMAR